jgi:hypothetical protein
MDKIAISGLDTLQNLVRDGFRTCKRRYEANVLAVVTFPLAANPGKTAFSNDSFIIENHKELLRCHRILLVL